MTARRPKAHKPQYQEVYDRRTGERVILDPQADTATMRENMKVDGGPKYVAAYDDLEVDVTPCAGAGKQRDAYWRGDEGNEAREAELDKLARANARAKAHGNDDLI